MWSVADQKVVNNTQENHDPSDLRYLLCRTMMLVDCVLHICTTICMRIHCCANIPWTRQHLIAGQVRVFVQDPRVGHGRVSTNSRIPGSSMKFDPFFLFPQGWAHWDGSTIFSPPKKPEIFVCWKYLNQLMKLRCIRFWPILTRATYMDVGQNGRPRGPQILL